MKEVDISNNNGEKTRANTKQWQSSSTATHKDNCAARGICYVVVLAQL